MEHETTNDWNMIGKLKWRNQNQFGYNQEEGLYEIYEFGFM